MVKNRKDTSWNESYCSAAFNHIYATSSAHYKLCCHAGFFNQENPKLHDRLPYLIKNANRHWTQKEILEGTYWNSIREYL